MKNRTDPDPEVYMPLLLTLVIGGLVFAFGWAIHTDSVRQDAARELCIKQGHDWVQNNCLGKRP